jgi:hypothetical protein
VVDRFGLGSAKERKKTVTDSGDLLALLSSNFAYDQRIFPRNASGWTLQLAISS